MVFTSNRDSVVDASRVCGYAMEGSAVRPSATAGLSHFQYSALGVAPRAGLVDGVDSAERL